MAISLKHLKDELVPMLNKLMDDAHDPRITWAVYVDYRYVDQTFVIGKIEPWEPETIRVSRYPATVMKIKAVDEMGAFVEAQRQLDHWEKFHGDKEDSPLPDMGLQSLWDKVR